VSKRWVGLGALVVVTALGLPESLLGAVYKSRVNAQWSADNAHFWYRNDLSGGRREFVLVDLGKGVRQAAFDHRRVAKALGEAGVGEIDADRLPLDQLRFDLSRNIVFFRVKGRHFYWHLKTHKLTKIEKPAAPGKPQPESKRPDRSRNSPRCFGIGWLSSSYLRRRWFRRWTP